VSPQEIADKVGPAVEKAFGGDDFPNPDGWEYDGVTMSWLMSRDVPVAQFRLGERTLNFIIEATNPETTEFFRRTANYDVSYFSEDAADDEQGSIFERDRGLVEGFVNWIEEWDTGE